MHLRSFEDCRMRLFLAHDSRICNAHEAAVDAAMLENPGNLSVSIGDHPDAIAACDLLQCLACGRLDYIPIRGNARGLDQSVAQILVINAEIIQ